MIIKCTVLFAAAGHAADGLRALRVHRREHAQQGVARRAGLRPRALLHHDHRR